MSGYDLRIPLLLNSRGYKYYDGVLGGYQWRFARAKIGENLNSNKENIKGALILVFGVLLLFVIGITHYKQGTLSPNNGAVFLGAVMILIAMFVGFNLSYYLKLRRKNWQVGTDGISRTSEEAATLKDKRVLFAHQILLAAAWTDKLIELWNQYLEHEPAWRDEVARYRMLLALRAEMETRLGLASAMLSHENDGRPRPIQGFKQLPWDDAESLRQLLCQHLGLVSGDEVFSQSLLNDLEASECAACNVPSLSETYRSPRVELKAPDNAPRIAMKVTEGREAQQEADAIDEALAPQTAPQPKTSRLAT